MELTGERMIPEFSRQELIYAEHMARYLFAAQFVRGKRVLDIACGSGYGSRFLLDNGATSVVGVDNSIEAVDYAIKNYGKKDLQFIMGDAAKLAFNSGEFDVVVSFETIEHIAEQDNFLKEIKRVANDQAIFIISTPNSAIYPKGNNFHLKELSLDEFKKILKRYFQHLVLFCQHNVVSSYVVRDENIICGAKSAAEILPIPDISPEKNIYAIMVAGNTKLPEIFLDSAVLFNNREWEDVVNRQKEQLRLRDQQLNDIYNSRGWKIGCFIHRIRKSIPLLKKI